MKEKKILVLFFAIAIGFMGMNITNAKDAYSIGTDYGWITFLLKHDIDTSQDAKDASETFYSLGYNSYYNTQPTYDYMRGNNPNTGKPRMESEILFFSGHGNVDHMAFNYQGKGGDYLTGVYYGENYESSTHYKFAGIESYDMSKVKLAIYAGCLTGHVRPHDSRSCLAWNTPNLGAGGAIGWWESVTDGSFIEWEHNFFEGLILGMDVEASIDYANNFSYDDSRVKNVVYNGDMHLQIGVNSYSLNDLAKKEKKKNMKSLILYNVDDQVAIAENIESSITNYITKNIDNNFNAFDYKVEKNDSFINNEKITYYDYKQTVNDALLDYGFTIVVKNNTITKIIDNRVDINSIKSESNINEFLKSNVDLEQIKKEVKNEIEEDNNFEVKEQEITKKYDLDDKTYNWSVRNLIYEKDSDTFFVKTYKR